MVLALARFWADNTAAILAVEKRFPDRRHRVRYEDLVADPEGVTAGSVSGVPAGARWDIIGSVNTWEQVMGGGTNLSVAFRRRQLRYCDTGDMGQPYPASGWA
jgi:hypothetical protein